MPALSWSTMKKEGLREFSSRVRYMWVRRCSWRRMEQRMVRRERMEAGKR